MMRIISCHIVCGKETLTTPHPPPPFAMNDFCGDGSVPGDWYDSFDEVDSDFLCP